MARDLRAFGIAGGGEPEEPSVKRLQDYYSKNIVVNPNDALANLKSQILTDEDTPTWFNSFSGCDINMYLLIDRSELKKGEIGKRNFNPIRQIQTLSVSSARSVHPVRRLGESYVSEYTRGARTVAGSMVCVAGDTDIFSGVGKVSNKERKASKEPFFTDQIPIFNILIVAANEYGNVAHAALTDVTLTNFGITFSESDMYLESTYTYVARYYHPLLPDPKVLNDLQYGTSSNSLSNTLNFRPTDLRTARKDFAMEQVVGKINSLLGSSVVIPAYSEWIKRQ